MNNSVDGAVLFSAADVFILSFPIVVSEEVLVDDSINVDVPRGSDGRLNEVGFMSFGVDRKGAKEFLGLVAGFFNGEGFLGPVNHGVEFFQPQESQDYIHSRFPDS